MEHDILEDQNYSSRGKYFVHNEENDDEIEKWKIDIPQYFIYSNIYEVSKDTYFGIHVP